MNGRDRVLAHLAGAPVDRLPCMPITMQFAAGLIGVDYLSYQTDYRVLAEGQLRTAEQFGLDYVNSMSDPAVEAADCGATVVFHADGPAAIDETASLLADKSTLASLKPPAPQDGRRMSNRLQTIQELRRRVGTDLVVEGWIEGPCAEAADLRGINRLMVDLYDDPGFVRDLFEFVTPMEIEFARAQVAAGADMIGIGDAAASLIGPRFYREHAWEYERRMVMAIHAMGAGVRLHICGNTRRICRDMAELGCDIVDIDFLVPFDAARLESGPACVLLGNMDPVRMLRDGTPDDIASCAAQCHGAAGARHVVGAGCEVPRDTPHENLAALVRYAHEHVP